MHFVAVLWLDQSKKVPIGPRGIDVNVGTCSGTKVLITYFIANCKKNMKYHTSQVCIQVEATFFC